MAKKDTVSAKALNEVRSFVYELARPLLLDGWTFSVEAGETDDPRDVVEITCSYPYMDAAIKVTPRYQQESPDARFAAVCHELFHAVLSLTFDEKCNQREMDDHERVTSHVTSIFLGQYRRNRSRRSGTP